MSIRILLWAPLGAGEHYNGAGMNAYRLYGAMQSMDVEVTLVHGSPMQQRTPVFHEEICLGSLIPRTMIGTAKFLWRSRRWLHENHSRFDVFHGLNVFESTVLPAYWAQQLGVPAVVKPANHQAGLAPAKGLRRLLGLPQHRRKLVCELSGVISISAAIYSELVSYGISPKRIHSISNGVDTSRFKPVEKRGKEALRERLSIKNSFVVLFCGEVARRKRPHWIVPALKALRENGVDAVLVLLGPAIDGDYRNEINALAAKHGVGDCIDWRGHVTETEPYYQAADVFVLPSENEGFSNALLEATACGLPSVCTRVSGCVDVLGDGLCGRLIDTPEQLGEALLNFAHDENARHVSGLSARMRAENNFGLELIARRYHELFLDLMHRRSDCGPKL